MWPELAGRRVLVTGHTGFKGAWLVHWLARSGAEVVGFSDALEAGSLAEQTQIGAVCRDLRGDLRDAEELLRSMRDSNAEVVFHLAAQSLVRRSYREPSITFETNVQGTVNLLEAVRAAPTVRAVVVVTSDKCYRNDGLGRPFSEKDALGGDDPYSASKAAAEIVTQSYMRSFFDEGQCLVATARAGNVIGGGDTAEDRLVVDLVKAFSEGEPARLRFPLATRPFQHVLEPLRGYLMLAGRLLRGDRNCARAFNFGPATADVWTVERFAREAARHWGDGATLDYESSTQPPEAALLSLDTSEGARLLGYRPTWELGVGLERTIRFEQRLLEGAPAAELVRAEIDAFEAEALA